MLIFRRSKVGSPGGICTGVRVFSGVSVGAGVLVWVGVSDPDGVWLAVGVCVGGTAESVG